MLWAGSLGAGGQCPGWTAALASLWVRIGVPGECLRHWGPAQGASSVVGRGQGFLQRCASSGLEPEIQKLIAKHKQEVKKLRGLHAAELLQVEERAAQRHGLQAEALREQLEREKEALCRQERERAQQRWVSLLWRPRRGGGAKVCTELGCAWTPQ